MAMKAMIPVTGYIPRARSRRNLIILAAYVVFLVIVVLIYAWVFRYMMAEYENDPGHTFINGIYWTITTMTTLGYGDITFTSPAGQLFSAFVTLSGFLFILILVPFAIVSVIFGPWLESVLRYRPRMRLKRGAKGHVVICGWDSVTEALTKNLVGAGVPYVVLMPDVDEVRRLDEARINTALGTPTDAEALKRVRVENARMVVGNMSDPDNTNLVLTVASICPTPVTAVVTEPERKELLAIAGAAHVVPLRETLGNHLAVRATTQGAMSHVVDVLGDLLFAEMPSHGTPFVGQPLKATGIRTSTGVSVIGIWERGRFSLPEAETIISDGMVMLLVGTESNLRALEQITGERAADDLVIILGYGAVGRAAAALLKRRDVPYVIVDRDISEAAGGPHFFLGDASKRDVLERAGITQAKGLIVTTNDDGTNVFLTLAGRHLNPHIRIVARANREENVEELYAAGADFIVSHSSVGASILSNIVQGRQNVFLAEGIRIFSSRVPDALHGRTLADSGVRDLTGATVVAIQLDRDRIVLDLTPDTVLDRSTSLILVGAPDSEALFSKRFGERNKPWRTA